jgi:hypothetical protein
VRDGDPSGRAASHGERDKKNQQSFHRPLGVSTALDMDQRDAVPAQKLQLTCFSHELAKRDVSAITPRKGCPSRVVPHGWQNEIPFLGFPLPGPEFNCELSPRLCQLKSRRSLFLGPREISACLVADDVEEIAHRQVNVDEVQPPIRQHFTVDD